MTPRVTDARFITSARSTRELPPPAFAEVAFAGRSNVGKSSLINSLVERKKLVRTSNTPGCTRGINVFRITIQEPDAVLDLVDLPGYGFAKRSKTERRSWGPLIEGFLRTRPGLRAVVAIVDLRRGIEPDDRELLAFVEAAGAATILVATKIDKVPTSKRKPAIDAVKRAAAMPVVP